MESLRKFKRRMRELERDNAVTIPDIGCHFDDDAKALADKIVADGYAIFTGNRPSLEMARLNVKVKDREYDDHCTLRTIPAGYSQAPELCGNVETLIHDKASAPTESARDTAQADIRDSGAPGTQARMDALAAHYAAHDTTTGQGGGRRVTGGTTPFGVTDDTIARMLAGVLDNALPVNSADNDRMLADIADNIDLGDDDDTEKSDTTEY